MHRHFIQLLQLLFKLFGEASEALYSILPKCKTTRMLESMAQFKGYKLKVINRNVFEADTVKSRFVTSKRVSKSRKRHDK